MTVPNLHDVYRLQTLASLEAGAGGWLFELSTPDEEADVDHTSVWWLDRKRRLKRLTAEAENAFGARWSPDGDQVAFVRSVEGKAQAFVLPLNGGEARQLSRIEDGVVSIEQWLENRLLLVAHRGAKPDKKPYVVDHLPYKMDGLGPKVGQSNCLYEVDAETGQATAIVEQGGDIVEARWSPDGETVAYVQKWDGPQRHRMDLWLKQRGQSAVQLTKHLVSLSGLSWSPDGGRIALGGSRIEGSSMSSLFVIDIADGRATKFDVELAIPTVIKWTPDGEALLVLEAWKGNQRISRVDLDKTVRPLRESESQQIFGFGVVADEIAYIAAGPTEGPELWVCQSDGRDATAVSEFNVWRNANSSIRWERRHFEVPDGRGGSENIDGWLLYPSGPGPFPLLLDMHGGPHSLVTFEHETHGHWPVLIEKGWAVLALNPVGTNSYGEDFARRLCGHWGELDLPQWLAAVESLRKQGVANEELAVFGHSYGGFLSAWALTQGVPLRCGAVSAGVIDMESHTGTSDTGYYVGPYALGCEPDEQRERYGELSPLWHAAAITAPTLLLQGDADERCPLGQAEELFTRLIRRGRAKVRMVVFPGGTHHVSSTGRPSHRFAFYKHLVDWLQEHRAGDGIESCEGASPGAWTPTDECREDESTTIT